MSGADLVMSRKELLEGLRFNELFPQQQYCLPLSRAALAGGLDLAFMRRETAMPRAWTRARRNQPLVAVIIDTVGKPAGPATWRSAGPLAAWADIAVLHRAGAEQRHYEHAAELAKTHLRTLLIQAPGEVFGEWLALLERRAGLPVEVMR